MLRSRETSPGRTNAHQQLVRPSPLGSSVDVCVKCSHRTHTVKLHLIWIPKGRRMEGLQYYWPWCSSGDLRGVTRSRVQKCFRQSGRKVKIGRPDRAWRSPTLFREVIANKNVVLRKRWRSEISSMGSKSGLHRASITTARSHVGTRERTGGLILSAPRRKRITRGCLPTVFPSSGEW